MSSASLVGGGGASGVAVGGDGGFVVRGGGRGFVEVGGGGVGGKGVRRSEGGFDAFELETFERRLREGGELEELLAGNARGKRIGLKVWVAGFGNGRRRSLIFDLTDGLVGLK